MTNAKRTGPVSFADVAEGFVTPRGLRQAAESTASGAGAANLSDRDIDSYCRRIGSFPYQLLARERVMSVQCRKCGAVEDDNCVGERGQYRTSNHMERVFDALRRFYQFT